MRTLQVAQCVYVCVWLGPTFGPSEVPRTATQLQICCDGEGLGVGSKHGGPRKDTATHGLHPDLLVEGI